MSISLSGTFKFFERYPTMLLDAINVKASWGFRDAISGQFLHFSYILFSRIYQSERIGSIVYCSVRKDWYLAI
jgi:hypothetical protein